MHRPALNRREAVERGRQGLNRPVRWEETRSEDMVALVHGRGFVSGIRPFGWLSRRQLPVPAAPPPPRHVRGDDDLPDVRFRVVVQPGQASHALTSAA